MLLFPSRLLVAGLLATMPAQAQDAAPAEPAAEAAAEETPGVEELLEQERAKREALRALELPAGSAAAHCAVIEGSKSPDGRYAFAYGMLAENSTTAAGMKPSMDGPAVEVTCLIDVKADRILAMSSVSHGGTEESYNHNTHKVVWAPDSSLVLQLAEGKWETLQSEAFRIRDGKATWLTDFLADVSSAVAGAVKSLDGVPVLSVEIKAGGLVSGIMEYTVPKSEDDEPKKYTFTGRFASDGLFAALVKGPGTTGNGKPFKKAPAVKWSIKTTGEDEGEPHTVVKLLADGKTAPFAISNKLAAIAKADWPQHKIPADALIAVGGWWAGGGEYYYLKYEAGALVAYRAFVEEGGPAEQEYFAFKTFVPADFK